MKTWTVYGIGSAAEGIKYVGCTSMAVERRLMAHVANARSGRRGAATVWLREAIGSREPILGYEIARCTSLKMGLRTEAAVIAALILSGAKLVNVHHAKSRGPHWTLGRWHYFVWPIKSAATMPEVSK